MFVKIAYWIIAGLLAALYLYSGGLKLVQSQEQLQPMMKWVDRTPCGWSGPSAGWKSSVPPG